MVAQGAGSWFHAICCIYVLACLTRIFRLGGVANSEDRLTRKRGGIAGRVDEWFHETFREADALTNENDLLEKAIEEQNEYRSNHGEGHPQRSEVLRSGD